MDIEELSKKKYAFTAPPEETPFSTYEYDEEELTHLLQYMLSPTFCCLYSLSLYVDDPFSDEKLPAVGSIYADDEYRWSDKDACLVGLYHIEVLPEFLEHVRQCWNADNKVIIINNDYETLMEAIKNKQETGKIWKEFLSVLPKDEQDDITDNVDDDEEISDKELDNILKYMLADEFRKSEIIAVLGRKHKPVYAYWYEDGTYKWDEDAAWSVGLHNATLAPDFIKHIRDFYNSDNDVEISDKLIELNFDMQRKQQRENDDQEQQQTTV